MKNTATHHDTRRIESIIDSVKHGIITYYLDKLTTGKVLVTKDELPKFVFDYEDEAREYIDGCIHNKVVDPLLDNAVKFPIKDARSNLRYTGKVSQSHRIIDKKGMYATQVYDSEGEAICTMEWYGVKTDERTTSSFREGNAKYIVKCWNMHDELLESLELALTSLQQTIDYSDEVEKQTVNFIRETIIKATE